MQKIFFLKYLPTLLASSLYKINEWMNGLQTTLQFSWHYKAVSSEFSVSKKKIGYCSNYILYKTVPILPRLISNNWIFQWRPSPPKSIFEYKCFQIIWLNSILNAYLSKNFFWDEPRNIYLKSNFLHNSSAAFQTRAPVSTCSQFIILEN